MATKLLLENSSAMLQEDGAFILIEEKGHPDGNEKCFGTINGDLLTDDEEGEMYTITLGEGYNFSADTKYAIVVKALEGSSGNCIEWRFDITTPTYEGGNYETTVNGGLDWTANTGRDFIFEEWSLSSGFRKQVKRILSDSSTFLDNLPGFVGRYAKIFVDSITTIESTKFLKSLARTFSERVEAIELVAKVRKVTRALSDAVQVMDSTVVTIRKVFTDIVDALESVELKVTSFIPEFFEKIFTESMQTTDSIKKAVVRSYSDILSVIDTVVFTKSLARIFVETIDTIENVGKKVRKVVLETTNLTDKLIRGRVFSEAIVVVDSLTKMYRKILFEITEMSDWWGLREHVLNFIDRVNTIDLMTSTNKFFRMFTDSVSVVDSAIRRAVRLLVDSVNVVDSVTRHTLRSFVDSVNVTDSAIRRTLRSFADSVNVADSTIRHTLRSFVEHINVIDVSLPVKGFFRIFSDAINVVDVYNRTQSLGRTLSESLTVVDSAVRQTIKTVIENVVLTEKLIRGRVFTDSLTMVDRIVKQARKHPFSELVTVTEVYTGVIWVAVVKLFAKVYELRFIVPTYTFKFLMYKAKEGMKTKFKFLKE